MAHSRKWLRVFAHNAEKDPMNGYSVFKEQLTFTMEGKVLRKAKIIWCA